MQGPSIWFDTRLYLAVVAALLLVIVYYNVYIAAMGVMLLYALYLYGRERYAEQQKEITTYLESMRQHVDEACNYALHNLPLAIAVIDQEGRLRWRNNVLADWFAREIEPGQCIFEVWPELTPEDLTKAKNNLQTVKKGERHFQLLYTPVTEQADKQRKLSVLFITDITAAETIRTKCQGALPVISYIQIDNYSDVLKGLTDSQRTAILAEVNRRLDEWITTSEGVLKKISEDTYFALFSHAALDKILNDKFDILDKVRSIHGGNKIPVTLSIGVAADEPSILVQGQKAQAGLDLALGRGGDQAAVYADGKVQFYGGKAKAVEKNTRVKARIVSQAIREMIEDADKVLIMGHSNEDFDSLGAAFGVAAMARRLGKPVHIVVSQPGVAVGKLAELLVEYEEYRNTLINPAQASEASGGKTLLFVVDTHRPDLTAAPALLEEVQRVIVIDHHRRAEDFIINPLLVYLEPSSSSTSELVTELLTYFDNDIDLTRLEATALYAGIVVDTKNFAVQTGVRTFEAASYLRRAGADPRLVRHLFKIDFDTLRHRADIINNAEMYPGGVVIATCPHNIKNSQMVAAQAADMLLNIEEVRASFVLFNSDEGIGISARSQGEINVQVIMEQLGGGGHQTMAGAQLKNAELEEVKRRLAAITAKYIEESGTNEGNSATRS